MKELCLALVVLALSACSANLSAKEIEAGYTVNPPRMEY